MKRFFIALSVIKRDENNELEDMKFMNYELEAEEIGCLDEVHSFENMVKDDLIKNGYIEDESEKLDITVINFKEFGSNPTLLKRQVLLVVFFLIFLKVPNFSL